MSLYLCRYIYKFYKVRGTNTEAIKIVFVEYNEIDWFITKDRSTTDSTDYSSYTKGILVNKKTCDNVGGAHQPALKQRLMSPPK